MIPVALRGTPTALLALLAAWAAWDILAMRQADWMAGLAALLVAGLGLSAAARVDRLGFLRRAGLAAIGAAYLGAHALDLGIDLAAASAFVTLGIVQVESRILADRFEPLYERDAPVEIRGAVGSALARAVQRLSIAAGLAVLAPILAADLAISGVLPATSIPSAVLLAAGFILTVALLALLPARREFLLPRSTRDQKPN